ncbi:elastase-1-like [Lethenteron reissneri]|uniref:elastase-1-like n=1 Tax=Lethenteron reissneri TaxID=7753 RepID=UPI002AB779D6|nr:elastase-1-like [Lethenteron reissneri]
MSMSLSLSLSLSVSLSISLSLCLSLSLSMSLSVSLRLPSALAARASSAQRYLVRLGKHELGRSEPGEVNSAVSTTHVHPSWDDNPMKGFDIALLELRVAVPLGASIGLVPLPGPGGAALGPGATCVATGWGRVQADGPLSPQLREAELPIVTSATCAQVTWWGALATERVICAGDSRSVCNGDSGGPLSCRVGGAGSAWQLHGVTSFVSAAGCAAPRKPAVFTRVSAHVEWVADVTGLASSATNRPAASPPLLLLLALAPVLSWPRGGSMTGRTTS